MTNPTDTTRPKPSERVYELMRSISMGGDCLYTARLVAAVVAYLDEQHAAGQGEHDEVDGALLRAALDAPARVIPELARLIREQKAREGERKPPDEDPGPFRCFTCEREVAEPMVCADCYTKSIAVSRVEGAAEAKPDHPALAALKARMAAQPDDKVAALWAKLQEMASEPGEPTGEEKLVAYVRHDDGSRTPITPKQWAQAVLANPKSAPVAEPPSPVADEALTRALEADPTIQAIARNFPEPMAPPRAVAGEPDESWEAAWGREFPSLVEKHKRDHLSNERAFERAGFKYGFLAAAKQRDTIKSQLATVEAERDALLKRNEHLEVSWMKEQAALAEANARYERSQAQTDDYEKALEAERRHTSLLTQQVAEANARADRLEAERDALLKYYGPAPKQAGEPVAGEPWHNPALDAAWDARHPPATPGPASEPRYERTTWPRAADTITEPDSREKP